MDKRTVAGCFKPRNRLFPGISGGGRKFRLTPHTIASRIVRRFGDYARRIHLAVDLDFEFGAVGREFGRHVTQRHRLPQVVHVAARGHVADAFAVLQDGFVVADVDVVGVDGHRHQFDRRAGFALGERRFLADEILVPVDESVEARLRGGEIRAKVERPRAPVKNRESRCSDFIDQRQKPTRNGPSQIYNWIAKPCIILDKATFSNNASPTA